MNTASRFLDNVQLTSSTTAFYSLALLVLYPVVCSSLRFRAIKALQRKYRYGTAAQPSFEGMTDQEAFEIVRFVSDTEFPALFEKGLNFALFRTYAIPTISSLLVKTQQLSTTKYVGKRYADTTVLLVEIYSNAPSDSRSIEAFARLNYLHGFYIRQGKISNDDLLYTLALFMNQPKEWINRYEWRQLTPLEMCAFGVFHKSMGDAMEISFDVLPGFKTGWKDGLQFFRELDDWSKTYEEKYMVPHQKNYETAVKTKEHFMTAYPSLMHRLLGKVITAVMDDRLREGIMFDKPPPGYARTLNRFMAVRRWFLRYLALPRPEFLTAKLVSKRPKDGEKRFFVKYDFTPVYVKPTILNRYGPTSWFSRMIGAPLPGDDRMYPEGYLIKDAGPQQFLGKGSVELDKTKQRLEAERTGGCPFAKMSH